MSQLLKSILKSLKDSNYLAGKCVVTHNGEIHCQSSLLKNGFKLRDQLLNQWIDMCTMWTAQYSEIQRIERSVKNDSRVSFLQCSEFQKSYEDIYKKKVVTPSNSVCLKTICDNANTVVSQENIFYGTNTKTLLVTDFFVAGENELSNYYKLQRERKIWWMRFSANPSRYWVEPFDICLKEEANDKISKKSKSITIKANFPFGLADMESISLVPLYEVETFLPFTEKSYNVSLIRSVIDLDLTTNALMLDASASGTKNRSATLMLNRRLAPYQILLANLHQKNKIVDELTLHLQHILNRSTLRLYENYVHTKNKIELEKEIQHFDSLGIPYILLIDDESIKSGLIKLRCRDTTLCETIHISDIPNYLLNIFKQ